MKRLATERKFIREHKGFSLVEIIVTIAIASVLVGGSAMLLGNLQYANTKAAVESVHTMLEKQRITTMTKEGDWYLYIFKLSDGYYMKLVDGKYDTSGSVAQKEGATKICNNSIQISTSSSGTPLGYNDFIRIAYSRNGVFSADTTLFVEDAPNDLFAGSSREARILFEGSGSHNVTLYKDTGKNFVDEP